MTTAMSHSREVPRIPTFRSSQSHEYKKLSSYKKYLKLKSLFENDSEEPIMSPDEDYAAPLFRQTPLSFADASPQMPPLLKINSRNSPNDNYSNEPNENFTELVHSMYQIHDWAPAPTDDIVQLVQSPWDATTDKYADQRSSQPLSSNEFSSIDACKKKQISIGYGRSYPAPSGSNKTAFPDVPTNSPHRTISDRNFYDNDSHQHSATHRDNLSQSISSQQSSYSKDTYSDSSCRSDDLPVNYRQNYPVPSGSRKCAFLDVFPANKKSEPPSTLTETIARTPHSPFLDPYKYTSDDDALPPIPEAHQTYRENLPTNHNCQRLKRECDKTRTPDHTPLCSQSSRKLSPKREFSHEPYNLSHHKPTCVKKNPPPTCKARIEKTTASSSRERHASEDDPQPPQRRGPGRPRKPENEKKRKPAKSIPLWKFLLNMLHDPSTCPELVKWEDISKGTFRIVRSDVVAARWGMRKDNTKMNYEKFSRAMRYYYKQHIFEAVPGKRLVYQFGIAAKDWRPKNLDNPNFDKDL